MNDRIVMLKLRAKPFDIAVIQVYAPTQDYTDEEIESFYEDVQDTIKQLKSTDILVMMGDLNAKVGSQRHGDVVGNQGLGEKNDRGDRLVQFCEENKLMIANTFFNHPKRRLYTWSSPGDLHRNQIDYIMMSTRHRNAVRQVKTFPGADIGSDHNPVVATIVLKLKTAIAVQHREPAIDFSALKEPDIRRNYNVEVQNRYDSLMQESSQQDHNAHFQYKCLKESIQTASNILPRKQKSSKRNG